jgi:hypothetical protein
LWQVGTLRRAEARLKSELAFKSDRLAAVTAQLHSLRGGDGDGGGGGAWAIPPRPHSKNALLL